MTETKKKPLGKGFSMRTKFIIASMLLSAVSFNAYSFDVPSVPTKEQAKTKAQSETESQAKDQAKKHAEDQVKKAKETKKNECKEGTVPCGDSCLKKGEVCKNK